MDTKPKRIKGIEYPSSQSLIVRKREFIADPDGYYAILGLDPNEKTWAKHEIKDKFRSLVKVKGHDPKLIEAYKTLVGTKKVIYDSLTKTIERLIEEVSKGKKKFEKKEVSEKIEQYAYYIDSGIEENYDLALEWMKMLSIVNHRLDNDSPVKVVLSNKFEKVKYSWGELVYVNTDFEPTLEILAYYLLKDQKTNWYPDYSKIIRKWG